MADHESRFILSSKVRLALKKWRKLCIATGANHVVEIRPESIIFKKYLEKIGLVVFYENIFDYLQLKIFIKNQ